jgi:hypothetical protein
MAAGGQQPQQTAVSVPPGGAPNFGGSAAGMPDPTNLLNTPLNQMTPGQMMELGAGAINMMQNIMPAGGGGLPGFGAPGFGRPGGYFQPQPQQKPGALAPVKRTINRTEHTVENVANAGIYWGVERAVNQSLYNGLMHMHY